MSVAEDQLQRAVDQLRAGGLVAFPTETVYGLGADASRDDAVRRVFDVKGRPGNNPLIVHVSDEEMARRVAGAWPAEASKLARAFWPGPLSIVVPRSARVSGLACAGGPTVALRCPRHPLARGLIAMFGAPIVGPSANRSGSISPTRAEHVRAAFSEEQVLTLDGGPCEGGIESTVVALDSRGVRVLRLGLISAEEISRVLGVEVEQGGPAAEGDGPLASPGLLARHYAPTTPATLLPRAKLLVRARALVRQGRTPILILLGERTTPGAVTIAMPAEAQAYAAALYGALHRADAVGQRGETGKHAQILIERPESAGPIWDAIRDRLTRATTAR